MAVEGEVKNDGTVTFEPVGDAQTRINVEMDVEGESGLENVAGDLLGVVRSLVRGDLERFKQFDREPRRSNGGLARRVQDGEIETPRS